MKFGTIGVTTGWKPVFLLMHNVRCIGSSETLSTACEVIAVRSDSGKYQEVRL